MDTLCDELKVELRNLGISSAGYRIDDLENGKPKRSGRLWRLFSFNGVTITPFDIARCALPNFTAYSINDSGVIGGYSVGNGGVHAAVLRLGGCPAYVPNVPNGPNNSSVVEVVTDNGNMLIGKSGYDPFALLSKGKLFNIPFPSGYSKSSYALDALAVNDNGIVVGNITTLGTGVPVAAFEYKDGRSVDLTTLFPLNSGWTALTAVDINEHDEIIGEGMYKGKFNAFALRY